MSDATSRAEMPKGSQAVLDRRTVINGNANLLRLLKRGDRVLDVGCGSGAITKDIAGLVGTDGFVLGIDPSEHLISQAKLAYQHLANLSFAVEDINKYSASELFDVVTSARVLQWLTGPTDVVSRMTSLVKHGGCLTILDYNHEKVEFNPEVPPSMQEVYAAFLKWRADAGMDNAIADHLDEIFKGAGLVNVTSSDYSEISIRGHKNFSDDIALWSIVAQVRGPQLVSDGYVTEVTRQAAINDYKQWMESDAQYMKLYLRAITGYRA
ncbi:class I SAM-dependent methyltransferase [Chryseolinea sp. T2]|uniref:class I SAM-dependent methyltransferase n=1 Tax=Chryseolinea sp. T2 TaxID=3129255 RepID=UPI00307745AC